MIKPWWGSPDKSHKINNQSTSNDVLFFIPLRDNLTNNNNMCINNTNTHFVFKMSEVDMAKTCARCTRELNEVTWREAEWSGHCLLCQQKRFDEIAKETSPSLAIFFCCIAFDVPFDISAVDREVPTTQMWKAYCNNLRLQDEKRNDAEPQGFTDGVTDITKIFGANISTREFNKIVGIDLTRRGDKQPGTKAQRARWGAGPEERRYTTDDLNELDRLRATYASRLGQMDMHQEQIIENCAKWSLERDKYIEVGNVNAAQKLDTLIQNNLASENLRKKDAKPVEDIRIDSIVDTLEKAGLMKNGKFDTPDAIFEKLFGRLPTYSYTADAADQMILAMWNRMQKNDGMPELMTLPDDMRINDTLGEFAPEQGAREKDTYEKLGLIRMPKKGKKGDD